MDYTVKEGGYIISTDKNQIDVDYVHQFLTNSYWSPGISIDKVRKGIEGSLSFGMYYKEQQMLSGSRQVGFARMITDQATFAYLCDVFIDENYRGKGLGLLFMKAILAHPDLQGLRRILLATRDAHKLYEQLGFVPLNNPEKYMYYTPTPDKSK